MVVWFDVVVDIGVFILIFLEIWRGEGGGGGEKIMFLLFIIVIFFVVAYGCQFK